MVAGVLGVGFGIWGGGGRLGFLGSVWGWDGLLEWVED